MGPKKRKGGHRQERVSREADDSENSESEPTTDVLAPLEAELLRRMTWGGMSGTTAQTLAHGAYLGGCENIVALASGGAWGQNRKSHEQILRRYARSARTPKPDRTKLPLIDPLGDQEVPIWEVTGIIYPHDWVYSLSHHYSQAADRIFGISRAPQFWRNANRSEFTHISVKKQTDV